MAMSECQALHPDPDNSDSDFDGDEYDVEEAGKALHKTNFPEDRLNKSSTSTCLTCIFFFFV